MALKDLAREADMSAAKAHPYMVSFGRLGLIEQDPASGHYLLGPLALQLGLISLQQVNPVQVATPLIARLAERVGLTVAIAVWGDRGATIVRVAESPAQLHVSMRHGTVFSLTGTASGRLFAAFLDETVVKQMLDSERKREKAGVELSPGMPPPQRLPDWKALQERLHEVRTHRISRSEGEIVPGISAMAAPVFDPMGAITIAITAIGPSATFDTSWEGPVAQALKQCAAQVAERLGTQRPLA